VVEPGSRASGEGWPEAVCASSMRAGTCRRWRARDQRGKNNREEEEKERMKERKEGEEEEKRIVWLLNPHKFIIQVMCPMNLCGLSSSAMSPGQGIYMPGTMSAQEGIKFVGHVT
jgi:hypothetical protein